MKRFLSAVVLCFTLLLIGSFFLLPSTGAEVLPADKQNTFGRFVNNFTISSNNDAASAVANLLNLPAPPPPNPYFRPSATERDENFFNREKAPDDDAPIDDLLDYWTTQSNGYQSLGFNPKPSPKSLGRIRAEIEKEPARLNAFLNVLDESRETAEFVKKIYDNEVSAKKLDRDWRESVRRWLTYNSDYFSAELATRAQGAGEAGEYVSNQDELLALARVDWEKARPIVERLYNDPTKPVSQVLAKWAFYKHALETDAAGDGDRYRDELKQVVEDKKATAGMRDLALDALIKEKEWNGRDDWYYGLLEDETLADLRVNGQSYTGLTTMIYYGPADKHLEKMIELLKSSNPNVRNAAVRNLSLLLDRTKNPELIKAMLPWLENPKWAKEISNERSRLVMALRNYAIPESVPGLIAMLNEAEKRTVSFTSPNSNMGYVGNMTVNRPSFNSATRPANMTAATQVVESYPFRSGAIMALEKQKSPLAAGPLRQLLTAVETWERQNIVRALLASNGYSIAEQIDALEETIKSANQSRPDVEKAVAGNFSPNADSEEPEKLAAVLVSNSAATNPNSPLYLKYVLASQLAGLEEPSDELVKAVIDRINFQDQRNPPIAQGLRGIIQNWKGPAINSLLLRDLKDGKTTANALVKLLTIRRELREKQMSEIAAARGGVPAALGFAACLSEEPTDYDAILDGGADETKTALFACARLIRAALPVEKVAANLASPNKRLATAAERYLEAEDSPAARQFVLARHPNEARILGARGAFVPEGSAAGMSYFETMQELFASVDASFKKFPPYFFYLDNDDAGEQKLRQEVREDQELLGIYSYDKNFVRLYKDRAVFSWEDDPARYRERVLTEEEFETFKNFLVAQAVDTLPPFLSPCPNCSGKELLMLGKNGGRRIFVKADPLPPFFADLENIFAEFRRPPAGIRYYLEKQVAGLEVLFADDNLKAATLWKDGDDFRLLIDDASLRRQNEREEPETDELIAPPISEGAVTENDPAADTESAESEAESEKARRREQQLARQKEFGSYAWFRFDKTKLLDPVAQPPGVEFIPLFDGFAVQPNENQWKARAAGVEVRADQDGLYKIGRGQLSKLRGGVFYKPLVTPNGRWAIVTQYSESEEDGTGPIRLNLLTNKHFKISVPEESGITEAVAVVPGLNKVLLFSSYGEREENEYSAGEREGEFFLLDPETGLVQPVRGEARPLLQQTFRPLQAAGGSPDLFWAALPDREKDATRFGIYNSRTLAFKPLLTLPRIIFDSLDMWVDERESKIYFVYEGQLLALPLPKNR